MNIEDLLNFAVSWAPVIATVIASFTTLGKVILKYVSSSVIDIKLLMTKDEQQIGAAFKGIFYYGLLFSCGFILYMPWYTLERDDLQWMENIEEAAVMVLLVFLFILVTLALMLCFKKKSLSERCLRKIPFIIAATYSADLILFAIVLSDPAEYAIIDAYLSFVLVLCAWMLSMIQGIEYCLYLEPREGENTAEKIYVYRKVSDKFVLCGDSQVEDADKGCWPMPIDDVKKYTLKREKIKKAEDKLKEQACDETISENSAEGFPKDDCIKMKIEIDLTKRVLDAVEKENPASDQEAQN